MKTLPPTTELHLFRDFLNAKLTNGGADLSPEDALDEFRDLHPDPEEDDVAAIQAAIDDFERGERGMPLEEFDRQLRQEFPFLNRPEQ